VKPPRAEVHELSPRRTPPRPGPTVLPNWVIRNENRMRQKPAFRS
jgi:hypothetical protein